MTDRSLQAAPDPVCPIKNIRTTLPTILFVVHEASRTEMATFACDLIGRFRKTFNVVTILMAEGAIETEFAAVSTEIMKIPGGSLWQPDIVTRLLQTVVTTYAPDYAIANGVATRDVAIVLADIGLPVIALVHEFSGDHQPTNSLSCLYRKAARVVFAERGVAAASKADCVVLTRRQSEILPPRPTKSSGRSMAQDTVDFLQKLGQNCVNDQQQNVRDFQVILDAGVFDARFCFGATSANWPLADAVAGYLRMSRVAQPHHRSGSGTFFRRPMVGFNPLIYASENPEFASTNENPLAHFLRSGRPAGRWLHEVIYPAQQAPCNVPESQLRVALHGHFHYPDLLPEFLERLSVNKTRIALFLTTTATAKAVEIEGMLARLGIADADVAVTSNRGRDIGPFLSMLRNRADTFDVIGHLHSKKSPHVDAEFGRQWREFAFQHLLGGIYPMADRILQHFADDPGLGLVFPEDPHLSDWDVNREIGEALARRMKIPMPLPTFFDFPIGTMFWIRPGALKPMLDLALSDDDYPAEPLPVDGTVLHALERLVTFSAERAGYRYATTHVPGCWR